MGGHRMKAALALIYLAIAAALFASNAERYTATWTALAASTAVLVVAAILRIIAVVNAPSADR
jgi:hypothetical protein